MDRIKVDTAKIQQQADSLQKIQTDLNNLSSRVNDISRGLQWDVSITSVVRGNLTGYSQSVQQLGGKAGQLYSAIVQAKEKYIQTENQNKTLVDGFSEVISNGVKNIIERTLPIIDPITGTLTAGVVGGVILDGATNSGKIVTGSVSGPGATAKANKTSASAEVHLEEAKREVKNGTAHAGVTATVGKVSAEASASGAIMKAKHSKYKKDGKWVEKDSLSFLEASGKAGVKAEGLTVKGDAGVGTDMLGLDGNASGTLGSAKLEGEGKFSVGTDGITAKAEGKAMVAAVEGKASGSLNILGLEIKLKASGYAGAAGVEGKVGIEKSKFVLEGGAAAGIGGSIGIEVGFNETGWDNFVDWITFWD